MGRLIRRRRSRVTVAYGGAAPALRGIVACAAICAAFFMLAPAASARTHMMLPAGSGPSPYSAQAGSSGAYPAGETTAFRRIILPDLLVVAPAGLTSAEITRLGTAGHVRNMIVFDGAEITAGGRPASVIGVNPAQFRSWVPLRTASDQALWATLAAGGFVASPAAAGRLGLHLGRSYELAGAVRQPVTFGAAASLGVAGVDLVVDSATSRQLGLVHRVAALISAPGASMAALTAKVRAILGASAKIVSLRQQQQLPVAAVSGNRLPATYLELFKASAARYCPGLSWTVLAAIGQIESADGTNVGPSTAGALGPMQFLPSTWKVWGTDGFGQTGPPDIMNPYDAVPAAARLLCADGAAAGGRALASAIFDYNHASWYVTEVLALAAQYAADYR
jgi:Transglycosylase SLT domain